MSSARRLNFPSDLKFDEADVATARSLAYTDVQEWCTSRTKEYQTYVSALRSVRWQSEHPLDPGHSGLAIEDAKKIPHLEASEVTGWCDSRICEYKSRIRGLRSIRNSAAPINYFLPTELLMEVFWNVHYHDSSKNCRLSILRVCRAWYTVACETPQVWANLLSVHMDLRKPTPGLLRSLNIMLDRSATVTFQLSLEGLPDAVVELFIPHRHRISSFNVYIGKREDGALRRILESGMAQLRELDIQVDARSWERSYQDVPPSSCLPCLAILRLPRPHFPPESASSSLRHLKLVQCGCHKKYLSPEIEESFDPLLSALQQCINLETLDIEYGLPNVMELYMGEGPPLQILDLEGIYASQTTDLPALRSIYIRDYARAMGIFLSHIRFPDTTSVGLYVEQTRGKLCRLRSGLPGLTRSERVHATFQGSRVDLEISIPRARLVAVSDEEEETDDGEEKEEDEVLHMTIDPRSRFLWIPDFRIVVGAMSEVATLFAPIETVTTLVVDQILLPNIGEETSEQRISAWLTLLGGFRRLERLEVPKNTYLEEIICAAERLAGDGSDFAGDWSGSATDTIPESGFMLARGESGPDLYIVVCET